MLSPVMTSAVAAKHVTGMPAKQPVLLVDLRKILPVLALSTAVTDGAPSVGKLSAHQVTTVAVMHEACALAALALRTGCAYADLIAHAFLAPAWDQPAASTDVLKLVAEHLVETVTAKHVGWLGFGGEFPRSGGYTWCCHQALVSWWSRLGVFAHRRGFFI